MSRALRTIPACGSGCVNWRPRGGGLAIGGWARLCGEYVSGKGGGVPGEIRTHGPQIRNLMLYPAELRRHPQVLYRKS